MCASCRNTQGVDVPWSFDGAVTGTLSEESTTVGFVLVRVQAKDEAPLRALRFNGGAQVISTIAEVTFYGRDQAGNAGVSCDASRVAARNVPLPYSPELENYVLPDVQDIVAAAKSLFHA